MPGDIERGGSLRPAPVVRDCPPEGNVLERLLGVKAGHFPYYYESEACQYSSWERGQPTAYG